MGEEIAQRLLALVADKLDSDTITEDERIRLVIKYDELISLCFAKNWNTGLS